MMDRKRIESKMTERVTNKSPVHIHWQAYYFRHRRIKVNQTGTACKSIIDDENDGAILVIIERL